LGARFVDDLLGILFGQFLKSVIAVDGLLNAAGLVLRDITGKIFAIFPDLMLEVRPVWAFAHDGKLATFHALNLHNLLDELSGIGRIHAVVSILL